MTHARVIAVGGEPFDDVMTAIAALGQDEERRARAVRSFPFEGVLGSQGSTGDAASLGNGDWQVTFRRPS